MGESAKPGPIWEQTCSHHANQGIPAGVVCKSTVDIGQSGNFRELLLQQLLVVEVGVVAVLRQ